VDGWRLHIPTRLHSHFDSNSFPLSDSFLDALSDLVDKVIQNCLDNGKAVKAPILLTATFNLHSLQQLEAVLRAHRSHSSKGTPVLDTVILSLSGYLERQYNPLAWPSSSRSRPEPDMLLAYSQT